MDDSDAHGGFPSYLMDDSGTRDDLRIRQPRLVPFSQVAVFSCPVDDIWLKLISSWTSSLVELSSSPLKPTQSP